MKRANSDKEHMGLVTWEDAPNGKIQKYDASVAKKYLSELEIKQLERIVSAYLDLAELQASRNIPMTMHDWEIRLNRFLEMTDYEMLKNAGKVTSKIAKEFDESEFEKYRIIQDGLYQSDFDKLTSLEDILKNDKDEL